MWRTPTNSENAIFLFLFSGVIRGCLWRSPLPSRPCTGSVSAGLLDAPHSVQRPRGDKRGGSLPWFALLKAATKVMQLNKDTTKCLPVILITIVMNIVQYKNRYTFSSVYSWTPIGDRLCLFFRCQWQVEANGAISPALTPSPSPLPLTIEEDREFTYPSDVLIPPPGLMPGTYFDLPRIRLPPGIMGRLREVSGRARPQFRPSIK